MDAHARTTPHTHLYHPPRNEPQELKKPQQPQQPKQPKEPQQPEELKEASNTAQRTDECGGDVGPDS